MARGRRTTFTICLTKDDRRTLRAWSASKTVPARHARRGRVVLLRADGVPISRIAILVGLSRHSVYKWVQRFRQEGLAGLTAKPSWGFWCASCQARPSAWHDRRA